MYDFSLQKYLELTNKIIQDLDDIHTSDGRIMNHKQRKYTWSTKKPASLEYGPMKHVDENAHLHIHQLRSLLGKVIAAKPLTFPWQQHSYFDPWFSFGLEAPDLSTSEGQRQSDFLTQVPFRQSLVSTLYCRELLFIFLLRCSRHNIRLTVCYTFCIPRTSFNN